MYYLNNKGKSRGYVRKWWEDDPTKDQVDGVTWTDPGPPQTPDGDDVGINVDDHIAFEGKQENQRYQQGRDGHRRQEVQESLLEPSLALGRD